MADLQFHAAVAERGFEVAFDVAAGEVLAILGPNGAGKSTTLHVIAGLLAPDAGLVRLGGRALTDTSAGIQVATHDRRVGLLLQDPLLFPHLSVQANVEFAPRSRGAGRAAARTSAATWLAEVGLAELAGRKPGQLSGGQAQRVAIARALAAEPEVLLLDEPLAGLDVAVAASVRALLRRVSSAEGRATVLITHDLLDVLTLADRVMVLEDGGVAEIGPVGDVLAAPRSMFGARIAGVNVVRGVRGGPESLRAADGTLWHGRQAVEEVAGPTAIWSRCSPRRQSRCTATCRTAARATASRSASRSWTPTARGCGCARRSNPTARPDWPPTSPRSRRPACGWPPATRCGSRSRRRRLPCTPRRPLWTAGKLTARAAYTGTGHRPGPDFVSRPQREGCHIVSRPHLRHGCNTVGSSP